MQLVQLGQALSTVSAEKVERTTRTLARPLNVALVSMPFMSVFRPSIQIGLLKAIAVQQGCSVSNYHFYLDFAHRIGWRLSNLFSERRGHWGDWIFSLAAFGDQAPDQEHRLLEILAPEVELLQEDLNQREEGRPARDVREILKGLRTQEAPDFVADLSKNIPWHNFQVIGFTSTFQQNVASIALASAIKKLYPHVVIVFGGANFEGEMGFEFVRSMPAIDYGFSGEADEAFPEFLQALSEGRDPAAVPGVICRNGGGLQPFQQRAPFHGLDALPIPDYTDYFDSAKLLGLLIPAPRPGTPIPFESARGCWWGAKHHCTFCGLNAATMAFRSKTAGRVIEELGELARRHHSFNFDAVDNIVDLSYFNDFFKALAERKYDFSFFYEVKSNLTREQIKALRQGGVTRIQPGIESLSSKVLKLMDKGVTAIQNVNLLRWASYYGIGVEWNLIWGFPGESAADYEEQLAVLKTITHLEPPNLGGRIWMERFSPVFFDRERFPAVFVRPETGYRYIYPPSVDLEKIAYFFEYLLENTLPHEIYRPTRAHVIGWRQLWEGERRPACTYWTAPRLLIIDDRRNPQAPATHRFEFPASGIYEKCSDRPQSVRGLATQFAESVTELEIEKTLHEFCSRGLMMREQNLYLALALPKTQGR
jgi:ribosomal peptide maturation radical SAM protein 1